MERKERISGIVLRIVGGIVLLCAVFLLVVTFFFSSGGAPSFFGYNVYIVNTDAFDLIESGTAVITEKTIPDDIVPGNLIVYKSEKNETLIGEVAESRLADGVFGFSVIDDKKQLTDISQGQIIGKAMFYSDVIGAAARFVLSPWGVLVIAVLPCLVILIFELARFISGKRELPSVEPIKKQEEVPTYVPRPKVQPEQLTQAKPKSVAPEKADFSAPLYELPKTSASKPTNASSGAASKAKGNAVGKAQAKEAYSAAKNAASPVVPQKPVVTPEETLRKAGLADSGRTQEVTLQGQYSEHKKTSTASFPTLDKVLEGDDNASRDEEDMFNIEDILKSLEERR